MGAAVGVIHASSSRRLPLLLFAGVCLDFFFEAKS